MARVRRQQYKQKPILKLQERNVAHRGTNPSYRECWVGWGQFACRGLSIFQNVGASVSRLTSSVSTSTPLKLRKMAGARMTDKALCGGRQPGGRNVEEDARPLLLCVRDSTAAWRRQGYSCLKNLGKTQHKKCQRVL
ncbi:hypothetical protein PoB_005711700 [Plakobranchus ocellatus]|uniref:Uncharacterized protein n=1 Tax=Plakobranchus ocellatus TaxID=259542 RepID=A0AAV4CG85_9GAST|nr:hypothetical protein PoB_005711700 [Plakobranchus ocellatus]